MFSDLPEPSPAPRGPGTAAVLSLFCTGLGHLYCGRIVRGMGLFLMSLVFVPAAALAAWLGSADAMLAALATAVAAYASVLLFAVFDAWRLARNVGDEYRPKDYNNVVVYGAFILIGLTYPWGAVYLVREHLLEAFAIPSASMAPTIFPGDYVLANKLHYRRHTPQRFDVVVFRVPQNPGQRYIKRIIGLPGDTVEVKEGRIRINGEPIPQEPASISPPPGLRGEVRWEFSGGRSYRVLVDPQAEAPATENDQPFVVPSRAYFVVGDNRHQSRDSRHFSFVPAADLVGPAQCIYYPALTWSRLGAIP